MIAAGTGRARERKGRCRRHIAEDETEDNIDKVSNDAVNATVNVKRSPQAKAADVKHEQVHTHTNTVNVK